MAGIEDLISFHRMAKNSKTQAHKAKKKQIEAHILGHTFN